MNDAIQRTKKQWRAEEQEKLKSAARRLVWREVDLNETNSTVTQRTMERLMETLSEKQLRLLQHLEERYGSDTRATAARMLSEYTMEKISGQSIADRMTNYETICNSLRRELRLSEIDHLQVCAHVANIAHGGKLRFAVYTDARGRVAIRMRWKNEDGSSAL